MTDDDFADERRFFRDHKDRTYHARPATREEIEDLRAHGCLDGKRLAPGCYFYAVFKVDRSTTLLEGRIIVLEARPVWAEDDCERAWLSTEQEGRVRQ